MNERIQEKRIKIRGLATIIALQPPVSLAVKEQVDHEQFALELAKKNLRDEFANREADLKIAAMEKVVQIIKQNQ